LVRALSGDTPREASDDTRWFEALSAIAETGSITVKQHRTKGQVALGERGHAVSIYVYDNAVRLIGTVAHLEHLTDRGGRWWGDPTTEHVRQWARRKTAELRLGYLDVHPRDGLFYGVLLVHGELPPTARETLIREVAQRADGWEWALTGKDRW
jgi:hypothetical protein